MRHLYFEWLYQLVWGAEEPRQYRLLLGYLFERDFIYILKMDENRANDGLDLRHRFCYEQSYEYSDIDAEFNDKPCSVLEMIVALALRFEEQIMDDPEIGNRTSEWFWNMITNLGLADMDDIRFNEFMTEMIIDRFLHREYESDGRGGLFYIPNCRRDLRHVELWYQACWYFDQLFD